MFVEYDLQGKASVYVEDGDKCNRCKFDSICPLVRALNEGVVSMDYENVDVLTCDLFKPYIDLKVVGEDE